jgi:hypothetical protein
MKRPGFMTALAAVLLAVFAAVYLWQVPGATGRKLGSAEVARYLEKIERSAPMLGEERTAFLARVKAWAEADDGQPFYMLNLMRYHDTLRAFPGAPAFAGTPREANALYESTASLLTRPSCRTPHRQVPTRKNPCSGSSAPFSPTSNQTGSQSRISIAGRKKAWPARAPMRGVKICS